MKRKIPTTAMAMILLFALHAQDVINTDRPSQSYGTSVLGKGALILETGMIIKRIKLDDDEKIKLNDFATTFLRIGAGSNIEIQIATSYAALEPGNGEDKISGLTPIKLGSKIHIAEEKGAWPEISFVGNVLLPWIGEEKFRPDYVAPDFRFIFLHTLSERFSLGYNLGMEWNGYTPNGAFVYTLFVGISLIENLGGYVEVFGKTREGNRAEHAFDLGFTYLLSPDFQIDISYGNSYSGVRTNYFNIGAAWQFGKVSNEQP
jgi:outer membrane putative beta-barrel porin/alpha-amylase